jgi:IstB-like ATP binding protein
MEQTVRQQRALERRLRQARLPKQKTLTDYDFNFRTPDIRPPSPQVFWFSRLWNYENHDGFS